MKVCIVGAGAIGGHLAVRAALGGADVSVLARGETLGAITAHGLRVECDGTTLHARVRASADPAALGPQDAVLVCVKAPALPAVAPLLTLLLGPDTPVVCVMNGIPWWYFVGDATEPDRRLPAIDPGDAMWGAVGPARAAGGVIYSACTVASPGVVHVLYANNRLIIGRADGAADPVLDALSGCLSVGGMEMTVTDRIRDAVWTKLMLNLATGPLAVLSSATPAQFMLPPAIEPAVRAIIAEVVAIAAAMGADVAPDVEKQLAFMRGSQHRQSILQDLELGRPMEVEALYATPLSMAQSRGVATPVLDLLVGIVQVRARAAGLY